MTSDLVGWSSLLEFSATADNLNHKVVCLTGSDGMDSKGHMMDGDTQMFSVLLYKRHALSLNTHGSTHKKIENWEIRE